jgi:hypothetical protein
VGRRIFQLRQTVKLDTQRLRMKTIERLDQLLAFATMIASGQMKWRALNQHGFVNSIGIERESLTAKAS